MAGNMVIWSRGSKNQASCVYKAFTVDSPVQQVLSAEKQTKKTNEARHFPEQMSLLLITAQINITIIL